MTIDRIAPTRRPEGPRFGYQEWWDLLFLHWEVPVAELQARLPAPLEVDTFEGRAFVGLVPFRMAGVRSRAVPSVPYFSSFGEVNLRTYVHARGRDPGVYFFSLEAPRLAAVIAARALWNLPYFWSTVDHRRVGTGDGFAVRSSSLFPVRRDALLDVEWRITGELGNARPDTLEHFLLERYGLYTVDSSGGVRHARVHHAPYRMQRASAKVRENSLLRASGFEGRPLDLVLASPGVQVEVFPLLPVPLGAALQSAA